MFGKKGILFMLVMIIAMVAVGVAAVIIYNKPVPSGGTILYPPPPPPPSTLTLEVYKDSSLSIVVTAIDWGSLQPGGSKTYTVYLKNMGNIPGALTLGTKDWSPSAASQYIILTWDRENAILQPGGVVDATMNLSVSTQITGVDIFNFSIVITITG